MGINDCCCPRVTGLKLIITDRYIVLNKRSSYMEKTGKAGQEVMYSYKG